MPPPQPASSPAPFNAAERLLRPHAEGAGADRPALLTASGAVTYGELWRRAGRTAAGLQRMGVEPEQRVALYLAESAELAAAFWGVLRAGAVALPVSPRLSGAELATVLADSRARALIVDANLWPRLQPHRPALRQLRHVVLTGPGAEDAASSTGAGGWSTLAALESESGEGAPVAPTRADDAATWLYTSGTTGEPKAAVHLHRNLVEGAAIFPHAVLGLGADDLLLSAARMHFAYGLGNTLLFPPAVGCAAALPPGEPAGEALLESLARFRPTVFFAGPAHLRAVLHAWRERAAGSHADNGSTAGEALPEGFERMRFAVSAGEALPEGLYRDWRETFDVEVLDAIGSTENLTFYAANRPGASRPRSTGPAVPGFDLRLVDEAGRDVLPGTAGMLWVRGPTAAARYWNRATSSRATMRGEWLVTGDRFYREADGHFRFLGRNDDRFKVAGAWVAPVEVERVLALHPAVAQCAVVGETDSDGLARAAAHVVPVPAAEGAGGAEGPDGAEALAAEVRAHLAARLPGHKLPARIQLRAALPVTATGKVRRAALHD